MTAQTSLLDWIIVDNFAGGGGASTGMELATGRPVSIAVNHDPDAIQMHKANHPYTEHLQASVWDVDPVKVCGGRRVGLAWFSPDCKHFSKAKGAALVDRHIRGLAWIVLRWAATVRPDVIILENVEEFTTWGPVRKGKPIKNKSGQTYAKWRKQLAELGYEIDSRVLVAADYGAPTTRKRFYLVARCDGKPVVWPEPTHAKDGAGGLKPWRAAAEIIDWSLPAPSIFASKAEIKDAYGVNAVRPLANNTLRRIIRGVDKFTIRSGEPFIVQVNHGGGDRAQDVSQPMATVTAKHGYGVANATFSPAIMCNNDNNAGARADEPLPTVTTGNRNFISAAQLIQYHTEQTENMRGQGVRDPIGTIDASNRYGLATAQFIEYYGNAQEGLSVAAPLRTILAKDKESLVAVHIEKSYGGGYMSCGSSADDPLGTVTTIDHNRLTLAHVAEFKGQDKGQGADAPLRTITASPGEFGAVHTTVEPYPPERDMKRWPQVRKLLNVHCGYALKDNEVLLLWIDGTAYFITDIGLRMLTPRELFNAMGFPKDYKIEVYHNGKSDGRSKQVARAGNAVCPAVASAIVRANFPAEAVYITTMAELDRQVAV